jgi:tetratricopeptide (TPR) repeat protein
MADVYFFGYYYHKGLVWEAIYGREQADPEFARSVWYRPNFLFRSFGVSPLYYQEVARLCENVKLDILAKPSPSFELRNRVEDTTSKEQTRNLMAQEENWPKTVKFNPESVNLEPEDLISLFQFLSCYKGIQELINLNPEDPYRPYWTGIGYVRTHQWNAAIDAFENSLTLKPNFADAYFQLGKIWETRGDISKAQNLYQQALELLPSNIREDLVGKDIKTVSLISLTSLIAIEGGFSVQNPDIVEMTRNWFVKFKTPAFHSGKYLLTLSARGSQTEGAPARLKVYQGNLVDTVYLDDPFRIYKFLIESKERFRVLFEYDQGQAVWINGLYVEKL